MTLVERDPERNLLRTAFQTSATGTGRVVVLGGHIGVGKTAILQDFTEWAAEQGASVLSATASRSEAALQLGLVAQLLSQAPVPPSLGQQLQRLCYQADPVPPATEGASEAAIGPYVPALYEVTLYLADLVRQRQLLIAVDDVQHADSASLYFLSHLVRRMRSARVTTLLNVCLGNGLDWGRPLLHGEILRQPNSTYLRLDPLSPDGVAALLEQREGKPVDAGLARVVHAASGGSPLLANALIDSDGLDRWRSGADALDRAVLRCLYHLEPSLARLAEGVAVLGDDVPAGRLCQLLGMEPAAAEWGMNVLEEVGLLHGGRYRHPRLRTAVLGHVNAEVRASIHAAAAHQLHDDDAPSIAVARQVLAAGGVRAPWLVTVMTDAAERAFGEGDIDLALTTLRRARSFPVDPAQRAMLTAALARLEWWDNPAAAERHLDELVAAARARCLDVRATATLVSHLLWHGRFDEARSVVSLLDRSQALDGSTLHQLLLVQLTAIYVFPDHPPVLPDLDPAGICPEHTPDGDAKRGTEFLLHSRADGEALSLSLPLLGALMHAGSLDGLHEMTASLGHHDDARGTLTRPPTWLALLEVIRGEVARNRGDFDLAVRHGRTALAILPLRAWGVFAGAPLTTLLRAATDSGRPELADEYVQMPVPSDMLTTVYGGRYLFARGQYHLLSDRPHEAIMDLQACRTLTARWAPALLSAVPWWLDAARAFVRIGWRSRAREALREGRTRLGACLVETPTLRSRRPTEREVGLAAIEELHRSLFGTGTGTPTGPGTAEPGRAAPRARPLFARPPSDQEMPSVLARAAGLSDAESKVANLASLGQTNREIAERLYITVSTVEQHLTRVYRKLHISGRKDLRDGLSRAPQHCS